MTTMIHDLKEHFLSELSQNNMIFQSCLEKKGAVDIALRVETILDQSGSMPVFYKNGAVQSLIELLLPFALHFNDPKIMNLKTFADKMQGQPPIHQGNADAYVVERIISQKPFIPCAGRYFAPGMEAVYQAHLQNKGAKINRMVFVITGGDGYDPESYQRLIAESSAKNIFWQFIRLGGLHRLQPVEDILCPNGVHNTGNLWLGDANMVNRERFYDLLLQKYLRWAKEATRKGIIAPSRPSAA